MSNDSIPSNVSHLNRDVTRDPLARPTPRPRLQVVNNHEGRGQPDRFDRTSDKKPFEPKGHDRQLADLQRNGATTEITLMCGDVVTGIVTKRDKFTITLRELNGRESFYYKHAIESVQLRGVTPAAADEGQV